MADRLTVDELLAAVELVDAHIDAATGPTYRDNPLALDWARITKVCDARSTGALPLPCQSGRTERW